MRINLKLNLLFLYLQCFQKYSGNMKIKMKIEINNSKSIISLLSEFIGIQDKRIILNNAIQIFE